MMLIGFFSATLEEVISIPFIFCKLFHYVCLKHIQGFGKTKARTKTNQIPQYVVLEFKKKGKKKGEQDGDRAKQQKEAVQRRAPGRCAAHTAEVLLRLPSAHQPCTPTASPAAGPRSLEEHHTACRAARGRLASSPGAPAFL